MDEWLSLFDDSMLGNSALDRLVNASYQIVIEGNSYCQRPTPHRELLGNGKASNGGHLAALPTLAINNLMLTDSHEIGRGFSTWLTTGSQGERTLQKVAEIPVNRTCPSQ